MLSGFFADKPIYRKFLIVVSVVLFSTLIFSMLGALLVDLLYGVNMMDPAALNNLDDPGTLAALKLLQLLSTGIGMFLLPSIILAWLFSTEPGAYLSLKPKPAALFLVMAVVIMFSAVPVINLLLTWNQTMEFPSFLSGIEDWMKASEENATRITEALLNMHNSGELFYNLLIIAVLPALGEEFLFRGILQKLFKELTQNVHVAILITAIIFSAIHMQFYGFIPRMMLGMLFGYLLHWTGSLWVPVLAHFINNGAAVVFAFLESRQQLPFNQNTIGTNENDLVLVVFSVVILSGLVFWFWRMKVRE